MGKGCLFYNQGDGEMASIKKAKKAKLPKSPIKVKLSKSDKKKAREKAVNTALGVVAVILCVISSVLDVLSNKEKERI